MFNVGDKVRIRSWEDTASQPYAKIDGGRITHDGLVCMFTPAMKRLCGMEGTIKHITHSGTISFLEPDFAGFGYNSWMIERIEDVECIEEDDERCELNDLSVLYGSFNTKEEY